MVRREGQIGTEDSHLDRTCFYALCDGHGGYVVVHDCAHALPDLTERVYGQLAALIAEER